MTSNLLSIVTFNQGHVSTELEVFMAFLFRGNRKIWEARDERTDGQTDR